MPTKSLMYIDPQGRVVLPAHIRKALNLNPGNAVSVDLEEDGTIRLRPAAERCCICGGSVGKNYTLLAEASRASNRKLICYDCAQQVARAMLR